MTALGRELTFQLNLSQIASLFQLLLITKVA